MNRDRRSKERELEVGQVVMVRGYRRHEDKWVERVITTKKGDLSFVVRLLDGSYCRQHKDQMYLKENVTSVDPDIDLTNHDQEIAQNESIKTNTEDSCTTQTEIRTSPYPQ